VRKAGYTKSRVIILSIILVRTGVMEIGLKWEWAVGWLTLRTGQMEVSFHCVGTIDVLSVSE